MTWSPVASVSLHPESWDLAAILMGGNGRLQKGCPATPRLRSCQTSLIDHVSLSLLWIKFHHDILPLNRACSEEKIATIFPFYFTVIKN